MSNTKSECDEIIREADQMLKSKNLLIFMIKQKISKWLFE